MKRHEMRKRGTGRQKHDKQRQGWIDWQGIDQDQPRPDFRTGRGTVEGRQIGKERG